MWNILRAFAPPPRNVAVFCALVFVTVKTCGRLKRSSLFCIPEFPPLEKSCGRPWLLLMAQPLKHCQSDSELHMLSVWCCIDIIDETSETCDKTIYFILFFKYWKQIAMLIIIIADIIYIHQIILRTGCRQWNNSQRGKPTGCDSTQTPWWSVYE